MRSARLIGYRNKLPRLTIAAAGREGTCFTDLSNQLNRHRVGLQAPDCAIRADAFQQGQILTQGLDRHG